MLSSGDFNEIAFFTSEKIARRSRGSFEKDSVGFEGCGRRRFFHVDVVSSSLLVLLLLVHVGVLIVLDLSGDFGEVLDVDAERVSILSSLERGKRRRFGSWRGRGYVVIENWESDVSIRRISEN